MITVSSAFPCGARERSDSREQPEQLITHRFNFDQVLEAQDVFGNAAQRKAMKVIMSNE